MDARALTRMVSSLQGAKFSKTPMKGAGVHGQPGQKEDLAPKVSLLKLKCIRLQCASMVQGDACITDRQLHVSWQGP